MTYTTVLTSKGTTTIPKEIRDELGMKPGMHISFTKNKLTGEVTLARARTIDEIRSINKDALSRAGTAHKEYKSGDGYAASVTQKLGD